AMTDGIDTFVTPAKPLDDVRRVTSSVTDHLRRNAIALKSDLLRREVEKKTRTSLDDFEEKAMRDTAVAAAAAGTPEQAKAMLRKARGKLMSAAANGADTATLETMVRDFERLTKAAEAKQAAEKALAKAREKAENAS
ncbi:MAG: hypothetical protein JNK21_13885, partial [Rhodospirillaceae bacterium]|nr:hypothetical protein [Rhodospirillaceae bacterium]